MSSLIDMSFTFREFSFITGYFFGILIVIILLFILTCFAIKSACSIYEYIFEKIKNKK